MSTSEKAVKENVRLHHELFSYRVFLNEIAHIVGSSSDGQPTKQNIVNEISYLVGRCEAYEHVLQKLNINVQVEQPPCDEPPA